MKHVVVRCPGCGAEGGVVWDACEGCGNQLRSWCRLHSREIGWLDGIACVRCLEADMRFTPPQPPVQAPAPDREAIESPPAAFPLAGPPPRAEVTADVPEPRRREAEGLAGHVFVMLLTLLVMGVGGWLMGAATGYLYLSYGRGTVPETPLQFGKAGLIMGLIFGFVVYARYVAGLPGQAPPPPLPRPARAPDPAPIRRPAPPSAIPPGPPSAVPPGPSSAVPDPPPLEPSQWPGGRSPREILRGTPKSRAELGLPESPPPPGGGDVVSLGCGGAIFGMLAGWVAGSVFGANPMGVSAMGATVMGLGGLMVGLVRAVAFAHADRSSDEW